MNTHPNPAYDFFYRALGFSEREFLHLVAKDDRFFSYRGVVCKPDFVVLDKAHLELWVLDYKTRQPVGGMTLYEASQLMIYGLAVLPQLERELCRKLKLRLGILYANDRRLELVPDERDYRSLEGWIEPARQAYRLRGEDRSGRISADQLVRFICDPALPSIPADDGRRARGQAAHAVMKELGPASRAAAGT